MPGQRGEAGPAGAAGPAGSGVTECDWAHLVATTVGANVAFAVCSCAVLLLFNQRTRTGLSNNIRSCWYAIKRCCGHHDAAFAELEQPLHPGENQGEDGAAGALQQIEALEERLRQLERSEHGLKGLLLEERKMLAEEERQQEGAAGGASSCWTEVELTEVELKRKNEQAVENKRQLDEEEQKAAAKVKR